MSDKLQLIAIILTYNEAHNITECIESVRFADRTLVFDSYSNDDTAVLALEAGSELLQREFDNYAGQRNAALDAVKDRAEWVLFIDADERVTPKLEDEILVAIEKQDYAGWRMPRLNYIFGKLTRGAGWYPDYQTRLLRVGAADYDPAYPVHEVVRLAGAEGTLKNPLIHQNYASVQQFTDKQQRYTEIAARQLHEQGVKPHWRNFVAQPVRQFWWRFVTLQGYGDGLHGLRLSALMAWYELRKYQLLSDLYTASDSPNKSAGTDPTQRDDSSSRP